MIFNLLFRGWQWHLWQETQQFGLLRRFLRTNNISSNLSQRITRFLQYTYHQRETNSHDPYILAYLSKSLQAGKVNKCGKHVAAPSWDLWQVPWKVMDE